MCNASVLSLGELLFPASTQLKRITPRKELHTYKGVMGEKSSI
jgi:hypothetical protein